jgi:hypothetical protein
LTTKRQADQIVTLQLKRFKMAMAHSALARPVDGKPFQEEFMRRSLILGLFVSCLLTAVAAQVVITSTIVGTVSDPQAAMIPDAHVILRNVDTGVE